MPAEDFRNWFVFVQIDFIIRITFIYFVEHPAVPPHTETCHWEQLRILRRSPNRRPANPRAIFSLLYFFAERRKFLHIPIPAQGNICLQPDILRQFFQNHPR